MLQSSDYYSHISKSSSCDGVMARSESKSRGISMPGSGSGSKLGSYLGSKSKARYRGQV